LLALGVLLLLMQRIRRIELERSPNNHPTNL